jgi:hypothetical protein
MTMDIHVIGWYLKEYKKNNHKINIIFNIVEDAEILETFGCENKSLIICGSFHIIHICLLNTIVI